MEVNPPYTFRLEPNPWKPHHHCYKQPAHALASWCIRSGGVSGDAAATSAGSSSADHGSTDIVVILAPAASKPHAGNGVPGGALTYGIDSCSDLHQKISNS